MASFSFNGPPSAPASLDPALVRRKADELDAMGLHYTADIMRRVADEVEAEGLPPNAPPRHADRPSSDRPSPDRRFSEAQFTDTSL